MKKNIIIMVGRRLRNIRKSLFLSRRELEQKHGISANSIKAWEKGVSEIGIIRLMAYLKIFEQYSLKVSVDTLLQRGENYLDDLHPQNLIKLFNTNLINPGTLPSAQNNQDVELICNIFKRELTSLLDEKDTILKTLINNLPFKITLKDEHNNLLILNHRLATGLGGNVNDFEGKSCYDLLPGMAKKYHDDDLKVINTNTSLMNIIEPYEPPAGPPRLISTNKIPIICSKTNKKMVLVIAYTIG
jgi:transcriptional regulator with XRE-family HTH domain